MKPETAKALEEEAADYRKRGSAMIAHADRIDELIREDALFSQPAVPVSPAVQPTIQRFRRVEGTMTQLQAVKIALRVIGRPAPLTEVLNVIRSRGLPVKISNSDNLRSVMSRSGEFKSNGSGIWSLAPDQGDKPPVISTDLVHSPNTRNGHEQQKGPDEKRPALF